MSKRTEGFDARRRTAKWPPSLRAASASTLRAMTEVEFQDLVRLVRKRVAAHHSKRHAKDVARQFILKRRPDRRNPYKAAVLGAQYQECEILGSLVDNRARRWRSVDKRKQGVRISCREFSFVDNPLQTLKTLHDIAAAECDAINFRINFEDKYVADVGPYLMFGLMRERMAPLTSGGKVSGSVMKVLEAMQLREFLRMQPTGMFDFQDVWPLPLKQRRKAGSTTSSDIAYQPTTVELTADQIVSQVNHWLGEIAQELTEFGSSKIKGMIGEILNNAERHSRVGGDGEWITAGFMARRPVRVGDEDIVAHICHLCLFSPGRSISDTIAEAPSSITDQIDRYCRHHSRAGVSRETLAAVFAMQDGISRVEQGAGLPSGGTGLMDVVEFANEVGVSKVPELSPKVAIISGSTYIRFAGLYSRGVADPAQDERRLQWFNPGNKITEAPDGKFVMDLPRRFPGTLITMRFGIDGSLSDGEVDE